MIRVAFIVNPISGTHNKERIIKEIERLYNPERGFCATLYKTRCKGDATVAAARFAEQKYDIVTAVGGDGTVNEVARGLLHTGTALAIVPTGSGNGLARHFGIPMRWRRALALIGKGRVCKIDAGKINGEYFFCTAGTGFEATVGKSFNSSHSRGFFTYLRVCAVEYMRYRRRLYKIELPGRRIETKAFLITFANCNQWGNNVFIAPGADASDGMMDLILWYRAPMRYMWLWSMQLLLKRMKRSTFTETFRLSKVVVERESDAPVQIDGEALQMPALLTVEMVKRALFLLVP